MGRKGNCLGNAIAESFFKTIKTEMVYHNNFTTKAEAKLAVSLIDRSLVQPAKKTFKTTLPYTLPVRRTFFKQQIVCLMKSLQ